MTTRLPIRRPISPYAIGGRRLAHLILSPTVVDFFETALGRGNEALNIEDVAVERESAIAGKTLDDLDLRHITGVTVLAIVREGRPLANPPGTFVLQPGDQLLALGTREQLTRLERLVTAGPGG